MDPKDPAEETQGELTERSQTSTDTQLEIAVHQLLQEVLELPTEQRAERLARTDLDQGLRQRVLQALELDPTLDHRSFLERPAAAQAAAAGNVPAQETMLAAALAGALKEKAGLPSALDQVAVTLSLEENEDGLGQIGPFRLIEPLGQGGMGRVFLAEQQHPVARRVALKLIRRSLASPEAATRFAAERQAMARLSHPNIARIYEAGTTEDGHPFFAMEHVPGSSLIDYCDQHRLSIEGRLRIFGDVCAAVQHAHQKQILHRDLKPSNVLVTEVDGRPMVKVIDFGVAKALDEPLTGESLDTGNRLVGTPSYMSPEALRLIDGLDDLDTRTDVYSLGVLLYELLTGERPFGRQTTSFAALVRRIETEDPPLPSQAVARLNDEALHKAASARGLEPGHLARRLRGDLDSVVLQAVARERQQRYSSCLELGSDIQRHLQHRPVTARRQTSSYLAAKWLRRHRAPAAAGLLLIASLVAGVVARDREAKRANRAATTAELALADAQKARQQTEQALQETEDARARSQEIVNFLTGMFEAASPVQNVGRELTALEILEIGTERIRTSFPDRPTLRAELLITLGNVYSELGQHDLALELTEESVRVLRSQPEPPMGVLAKALGQVGNEQYRLGHVALSEAAHREAIAAAKAAHGDDSTEVARMSANLGITLSRNGQHDAAVELYQEALRSYEKHLGPRHPRVAFPSLNLSMTLELLERHDEALVAAQRSLDIWNEEYGPEHPYTLAALQATARLAQKGGDLETAEARFRHVLPLKRSALGEEHPDFADLLQQLAGVLLAKDELEESEELFRRSLAIREKVLGSGHLRVVSNLLGLGAIHRQRQRPEDALPLLQRAQSILRMELAEDHPDRVSVRNTIREVQEEIRSGHAESGRSSP